MHGLAHLFAQSDMINNWSFKSPSIIVTPALYQTNMYFMGV